MNTYNLAYDFDVKNSKKISEFRRRDTITKHQENSWVALAQYNSLAGSYHNLAINLSSITGYSISSAQAIAAYHVNSIVEELVNSYGLESLGKLAYVGTAEGYDQIGYTILNSDIALNLVTYTHSYVMNTTMWQYFPSVDDTSIEERYIMSEDGMYILTDKGKKIYGR